MIWIAFGVGLFLGTFAGIFVLGFCRMAAEADAEVVDQGMAMSEEVEVLHVN